MGGAHINPLLVCCLYPAARNAAARENKRMLTLDINDRKFKVTIEWSS
jgi:hypothetical protein